MCPTSSYPAGTAASRCSSLPSGRKVSGRSRHLPCPRDWWLPATGKIGALPEIAGSDEYFGTNVADTADIITGLLDDRPRREAIGMFNQNRAAEMFSVEAMTSSYRKLYVKLLDLA